MSIPRNPVPKSAYAGVAAAGADVLIHTPATGRAFRTNWILAYNTEAGANLLTLYDGASLAGVVRMAITIPATTLVTLGPNFVLVDFRTNVTATVTVFAVNGVLLTITGEEE